MLLFSSYAWKKLHEGRHLFWFISACTVPGCSALKLPDLDKKDLWEKDASVYTRKNI